MYGHCQCVISGYGVCLSVSTPSVSSLIRAASPPPPKLRSVPSSVSPYSRLKGRGIHQARARCHIAKLEEKSVKKRQKHSKSSLPDCRRRTPRPAQVTRLQSRAWSPRILLLLRRLLCRSHLGHRKGPELQLVRQQHRLLLRRSPDDPNASVLGQPRFSMPGTPLPFVMVLVWVRQMP